MLFVVVGLIILVGHILGMGPMAQWNWELTGDLWKFAAPFILAGAWWSWCDMTGITKRRQMKRLQDQADAKKRKINEALGQQAANQAKKQERLVAKFRRK